MSKLSTVLRFLCEKYPLKNELSNARLTKMVYLADWRSALMYGNQITDIEWYFDNFGPYVHDVVNTARTDDYLFVKEDRTPYGTNKTLIGVDNSKRDQDSEYDLSVAEIKLLESVIDDTRSMYWNEFIKYVYSTFPVVHNNRYTTLNLVEQATLARNKAENRNLTLR